MQLTAAVILCRQLRAGIYEVAEGNADDLQMFTFDLGYLLRHGQDQGHG